jgi:hypothetical protein
LTLGKVGINDWPNTTPPCVPIAGAGFCWSITVIGAALASAKKFDVPMKKRIAMSLISPPLIL